MPPMGDHKWQGRLLPWYIGGGIYMGWLIAVAAAVFIAAVFLLTLSICSMAEDDDEEQTEWIREIREKSRKRKDGSDSH